MEHYAEYLCCGRTSRRNVKYEGIAGCQLCGTVLKPVIHKEKPYNYVCSECGNNWFGSNDRTKQCSLCGSVNIIISYKEADLEINLKQYEDILRNHNAETKFSYKCNACGGTKELYSANLHNIVCLCGELMESMESQQNVIEKLKTYRKNKKLNQKQMADKLGISQNYLSEIELGKKQMPSKIIKFIAKNGV